MTLDFIRIVIELSVNFVIGLMARVYCIKIEKGT